MLPNKQRIAWFYKYVFFSGVEHENTSFRPVENEPLVDVEASHGEKVTA